MPYEGPLITSCRRSIDTPKLDCVVFTSRRNRLTIWTKADIVDQKTDGLKDFED